MLKIRKQDDWVSTAYSVLLGADYCVICNKKTFTQWLFLMNRITALPFFRKVLNARMKLLSKGLRYQSKTSLSYDTGRWGQDLDCWSIRVRLSSSSTVYTFITVRYSVWGLFDKHRNLGFLKLRISFQTVSGCVSS